MLVIFSLKQIVDIIYEYTILDYLMVILVTVLALKMFVRCKVYINLTSKIDITDFVIIALGLVYLLSFYRNTVAWKQICKIESAFLVYFVGRIYGNQNLNYKKICSIISYLVVYSNAIYRLCEIVYFKYTGVYLKKDPFGIKNGGAFYNYKTDLALGLIVASILIYSCSKLIWLKWITIGPVVGLIVFLSHARTCKLILIVEYILMFIFAIYKKAVKTKIDCKKWLKILKIGLCSIITLVIGFFIFIQCYEPLNHKLEDLIQSESETTKLFNIFHGRNIIWWDAIGYYKKQNFKTRLLGIDLCSEVNHNLEGDRFHNLYFKLIYSIGYIGTLLFIYLIYRFMKAYILNRNEELKYLFISYIVMFLGISLTMEGLEHTQMTWYGFIMAGIIVTQSKHYYDECIKQTHNGNN